MCVSVDGVMCVCVSVWGGGSGLNVFAAYVYVCALVCDGDRDR